MASSGMLRPVALGVILTRATWRNIPDDAILHSHRRENLKFYTFNKHNVNWQMLILRYLVHHMRTNQYPFVIHKQWII
jgi:hypothetical protein